MESQLVINISDYCAAEMYGEPEVQVFPKQLKQITNVQNVITQKQQFIETIPYFSIHNFKHLSSCYVLNKFLPNIVVTYQQK